MFLGSCKKTAYECSTVQKKLNKAIQCSMPDTDQKWQFPKCTVYILSSVPFRRLMYHEERYTKLTPHTYTA